MRTFLELRMAELINNAETFYPDFQGSIYMRRSLFASILFKPKRNCQKSREIKLNNNINSKLYISYSERCLEDEKRINSFLIFKKALIIIDINEIRTEFI